MTSSTDVAKSHLKQSVGLVISCNIRTSPVYVEDVNVICL